MIKPRDSITEAVVKKKVDIMWNPNSIIILLWGIGAARFLEYTENRKVSVFCPRTPQHVASRKGNWTFLVCKHLLVNHRHTKLFIFCGNNCTFCYSSGWCLKPLCIKAKKWPCGLCFSVELPTGRDISSETSVVLYLGNAWQDTSVSSLKHYLVKCNKIEDHSSKSMC